ncbi:MAG TPA: diguanylate cyclase [Candidatus Limnocylindrales bacterium]|jgi:diguanylate cyclase (GGDEF)-like protein|nr:diguanylate cyclase [Candidatus Limnocylindrales bacterium]
MNLSPSTLLVIFVVTALANVLILLAVSARARSDRARRFAEVDGLLSSSYVGSGSSDAWPNSADDGRGTIDGWPVPLDLGQPDPPKAEPVEAAAVEPFEYPAPTSLEQRFLDRDDAVDESDWEDEAPDEEGGANEDEGPAVDAAASTDADADEVPADEVPAEDIPADEVASDDVLRVLPTGRSVSAPRGRDTLTGLLNAAAFEEALSHEDAREQRYGRPATVIVFELDGLAKLVDRLGPDPGDRIETALGDTIVRLARRADYVARLERGRYAVLLPETDEVAAINYVERIRRACDLWLESGAIAMRLAIGWASTDGDAALAGAIRAATERMRLEQRRNARLGSDADDLLADEEATGS